MTITRVLVAHDAGARAFEHRGPGKGLIPLADIAFEDGRRRPGEIDTDRLGRRSERGGVASAYQPQQDAHQHAVELFARTLAQDLGRDFRQGAFAQLVLVAPPRFLGTLRGALDPLLERALIGTLAKDLPRADVKQLCTQLSSLLAC